MGQNNKNGRCVIGVGSITYALKAEKLLYDRMVPAKVVRDETRKTKNGCGYGVEIDCRYKAGAISILAASGIEVREGS